MRAYLVGKLPNAKEFNLPKSNDAGRVYDFHALRHQFASNLAAANVHPKTAQELLGHSTTGLTMNVYTHTSRGTLATLR